MTTDSAIASSDGATAAAESEAAESSSPTVAVVFVSDLAADTGSRVGGRQLVDRTLLALARAGIRRCYLAGSPPELRPRRTHPRTVRRLVDHPGRAIDELRADGVRADDPVVCLSADLVFQPQAISRLAQASNAGRPTVARDAGGRPLPLMCLPLAALREAWAAIRSEPTDGVDRLLTAGDADGVSLGGAFARALDDRDRIAEIERSLLLSLENPRDGRVDTLINRRLSRPLTRLFLRLPLTPNQITILSFVVCLLAALYFATGQYTAAIAGTLLFQLAAVLDCCDGEVARVKFLESRLGDVLDITLDAIGNAALFAGIAYGVWATGRLPSAGLLGVVLVLGALGAFAVVTYVEREIPEDSTATAHRWAHRLVSNLTTRDFSVIVLAAAVGDAMPWFLWGAAIGAHVFWFVLLGFVLLGCRAAQVR